MITIYTDGSARQKDGVWVGAYAFALYRDGKALYQESKVVVPATVNVCELLAITDAIHTCQAKYPNEELEIYSDSQYAVNGFKSPLAIKTNKPYWQLLNNIKCNLPITIEHVKGHDQDVKNKHVDSLAKSKLRSQF